MKEIQSIHVSHLQNMEFVTLMRETISDTEKNSAALLTENAPLKRMIDELKAETDVFETATKNPSANPMSKELTELDRLRDTAFRRFGRHLAFFELAETDTETRAYTALEPLWKKHRDTPGLNQKQQTGATDNFLNDTEKSPFAEAIIALGMQPAIESIRLTNNNYRTAHEDRRAQAAEEEVGRSKELRRSLNEKYGFFCNYVWTMANALPADENWDKLLTHINVIRKNYANLISRRRAASKKPDGTAVETPENPEQEQPRPPENE